MENPMRLRSRIKKVSEETGIPPDVTLHMYVMERFIADWRCRVTGTASS